MLDQAPPNALATMFFTYYDHGKVAIRNSVRDGPSEANYLICRRIHGDSRPLTGLHKRRELFRVADAMSPPIGTKEKASSLSFVRL